MITWIVAVVCGCAFIVILPWMRPRARPSPGAQRIPGVRLKRNEVRGSAEKQGSPLEISLYLPVSRVVVGMESRLKTNQEKLRSLWSEESKYFSKIWFRTAIERRKDFLLLLLNELTVGLEPYFCSNRDSRAFASEVVRAELLLAHEATGGVFFEQHVKDLMNGALQPHFAAPDAADPLENASLARFVAVLESLCASMYVEQVLLRYHRAEAKQRLWFGKWTVSSIREASLVGFVAVALVSFIYYFKTIYYD